MSKTKLRITFTVVMEYEPNPEHYPKDKRTPEGMLEVDLSSANADPFMFFEGQEMTVAGKVISKEQP